MSDKKPSAQAIKDLLKLLSSMMGKTLIKRPKERFWFDHDEHGNEIIDSQILETRKKQRFGDAEMLKLIFERLDQDEIFDEQTGRIFITRISSYIKEKDGWGNNSERNYRERVKELLPGIIGVVKLNGKFYYKNSKFYNPPA